MIHVGLLPFHLYDPEHKITNRAWIIDPKYMPHLREKTLDRAFLNVDFIVSHELGIRTQSMGASGAKSTLPRARFSCHSSYVLTK